MRSRKKGKKRKRERLGTNARALLHKPANIFFFYKPVICQAREKGRPDMQPIWLDKKDKRE